MDEEIDAFGGPLQEVFSDDETGSSTLSPSSDSVWSSESEDFMGYFYSSEPRTNIFSGLSEIGGYVEPWFKHAKLDYDELSQGLLSNKFKDVTVSELCWAVNCPMPGCQTQITRHFGNPDAEYHIQLGLNKHMKAIHADAQTTECKTRKAAQECVERIHSLAKTKCTKEVQPSPKEPISKRRKKSVLKGQLIKIKRRPYKKEFKASGTKHHRDFIKKLVPCLKKQYVLESSSEDDSREEISLSPILEDLSEDDLSYFDN